MFVWPDRTVTGSINVEQLEKLREQWAAEDAAKAAGRKTPAAKTEQPAPVKAEPAAPAPRKTRARKRAH